MLNSEISLTGKKKTQFSQGFCLENELCEGGEKERKKL